MTNRAAATPLAPKTAPRNRRPRRRTVLLVSAVSVVLVALVVGGYLAQNITYEQRTRDALSAKGFVQRKIEIDGIRIAYAEGPNNGTPILLVHGQGSRWQDYAGVLTSELATRAHLFAVDVPGHGASDRLPPTAYTAVRLGEMLARFVERVNAGPAVLAGHSSGALLVAEVAAKHPELALALLLEDPPFYSSQMPRAASTIGGVLFGLTHDYLATPQEEDFVRYFVRKGRYFEFFGPFERPIVAYARRYLERHPSEPLNVFFLPPLVNVYFEGLARYDPHFGEAWYTGRWYEGYDTDAVLQAIDVPTTLLHTNYWETKNGSYYSKDGLLMAAMDGDDLARARKQLPEAQIVTLASGHLVHFERLDEYVAILGELLESSSRRSRP